MGFFSHCYGVPLQGICEISTWIILIVGVVFMLYLITKPDNRN